MKHLAPLQPRETPYKHPFVIAVPTSALAKAPPWHLRRSLVTLILVPSVWHKEGPLKDAPESRDARPSALTLPISYPLAHGYSGSDNPTVRAFRGHCLMEPFATVQEVERLTPIFKVGKLRPGLVTSPA